MALCVQPTWTPNAGEFGIPDVRDPAQGTVLKNCSLIASLASMAWKKKISTQKFPCKFTFYDLNNLNPTTVYSDNYLPNPAHAKSDTSKIWPQVYEKAYYQYLDGCTAATGRPDYCKYTGWQSPVTLLTQLMGMRPYQKNCYNANSDTIFTEIDNWCVNCNPVNTNRTIKTPAVAWTNSAGGQYAETTIAVQHSYSLLGLAGKKDASGNWTDKYIVLRNPIGKRIGDPDIPPATPNLPKEYFLTTTWCNINFSDDDGVFALRADQFVRFFTGYAWTLL
jgi:hypothetical protein